MSKKAQLFQNVSAAINLDGSGNHEIAFQKYLQCLQMLSAFLIEQSTNNGLDRMDDNARNEMKQMLSVICDCADRAGSILTSAEKAMGPSPLLRTCESVIAGNGFSSQDSNDLNGSSRSGSQITSNFHLMWQRPLESSNSSFIRENSPSRSSPRSLRRMNSNSRYPVFSKVDEENAALFRKYQMRINNAKDKYSKQNLRLELQRRLAENLMIAKAKREEALKKQKEEKERALNQALKGMIQNGPCQNAVEQEKREIYLEVLHYEASQSELLDLDIDSRNRSLSEVTQKIFDKTLRCSSHPLFQWLTMVQMKLKKSLSALLKEYSEYSAFVPSGNILERCSNNYNDAGALWLPSEDSVSKLEHLQKTLEAVTQTIRESIDIIMEVTFVAYKSHLPAEADTALYKATECSLISPLWPILISLFRFSNLLCERKVMKTMLNCQRFSCDFGITADHLSDCREVFAFSVQQLKKLPSLISLVDKLSILVCVAQRLCTYERRQTSEINEILLGADELVPILCYVLVQTGMPQLVSECNALQLLVDQKYMLGEEGYCLTSFLTALNYLEMKDLINPQDQGARLEASCGSSDLSDNSLPT